ncbi:LUD domain-containing protein [Bacteroides sp. 51]|uniref:LutC/YkgG family protein n=1 Tax=Bacteroides sp. 51 TaxID=2302938 RepID=UPI0013D73A50|nr:LUD domain-containing protein [Bacteroides sp. 51]NDV84451.1 hypothetical protein [Bacteroides sp. 51]
MSTRNEFMNRLKNHTPVPYDMPELTLEQISYTDNIEQFIQISSFVGGQAIELKEGEDVNELIRSLYPDARNIASNLPDITLSTVNPDEVDDPHALDNLDLSVIEGEIGVAENGCIWIPQQVRQKVIYFISEYLVILLDKSKLVATMHDAYKRIPDSEYGFGVFISGPSKTADIEQALVVGAHGARGVTVILK